MGWSIGYDWNWKRDIGYSVPAICDYPCCNKEIDRGLAYVCGGEPYGGDRGCGLYFCEEHTYGDDECSQLCVMCVDRRPPFKPKPDTLKWLYHKMTHSSWAQWRKENGLPERPEPEEELDDFGLPKEAK